MKTYTIGEIYRLGLLKSHTGAPYKDKGTVSKVLAQLPHKLVDTPWGKSKVFTQKQIDELNSRKVYTKGVFCISFGDTN